MKKAVILQPGYLPWLGFFEQISRCDVFVYLDDVQYTKNDWRNRNRIKTKEGTQWLTVPVSYRFGQNINEVCINNSSPWRRKHLQAMKIWYGRSTFFDMYFELLERILHKDRVYLIDLDVELIQSFLEILGIKVRTVLSSEFPKDARDKQLRLVEICKSLECDGFYEGKSGQNYIHTDIFASQGITVEFQDYEHPYYDQLWIREQGFISHLSVLDLLFNHGSDSLDILTGRKIIPKPERIRIRAANDVSLQ
jgi:hypothetical protein